LTSQSHWAKLTAHPVLFWGVVVVVVAAALAASYVVWEVTLASMSPSTGGCDPHLADVDFLLTSPNGTPLIPTHQSSGPNQWYNYSILICSGWRVGTLYFAVGTSTCGPVTGVLGMELSIPPHVWDLKQTGSDFWWNANSSVGLPSITNPANFSVASASPLTGDQVFVWLLEPGGAQTRLFQHAMYPGSYNYTTCSPPIP